VGRAAELASLRRFCRAISSGHHAAVLAGDAGVGKTTLWNEAVAVCRRRSYTVLACCPTPSETHYPYAGLGDLFEKIGDEVLASLPAPPRRALEVALLRVEPSGHSLEPRRVAAAVRDLLVALSESGPVLVALDDVQWLDPPSGKALSFALRRLKTHPVGILLSVRADEGVPLPFDLGRVFEEKSVLRLPIEPLGPDAIERLLQTRLGPALPTRLIERLIEVSGGNPFFALELGRAWLRRAPAERSSEELSVPDSLRGLVGERLAGLPGNARGALLATSMLTRPTPAQVDAAAGASSEHGHGLDAAVEAGVVTVEGNRVRLVHPLLASVAWAETAPEDRRELHARLARLVDDPEERGRHLALAAWEPDEEVARALDEAALRARRRGAPEVAAALAEQAIRLTPPALADAISRRTFDAGDHHFAAGDLAKARALLDELRASARPGPARARTLQRLGEILLQEVGFSAAEDLFTQALGEVGDDDLLRLELECDLAFSRLVRGDIPEGARRSQAALELARSLKDVPPVTKLPALVSAALFEFLLGRGVRADLLEEAMAVEEWAEREALALRPGYVHLPHVPATILKWSDDLEGARARYEAAYNRTAELGEESWLPWLGYHMAELECWAGNWEQAAAYAAQAREASVRTGQRGVQGFALYSVALVAAHRGDVEAARTAAEEGLALCERSDIVTAAQLNRSVLGFLALSTGDAAGAHAHLGSVLEALRSMGLRDSGVVRCTADEIEALVALGELEQAGVLSDGLVEQGRALNRGSALAAGSRGRALVRAAAGDWDGALSELAVAREAHKRLALPFDEGRTLLVEGTIRRRARQKRAAREALEAALLIFESLGAPLWAEKARSELGRVGGRPAAPGALTPTEERVAALVATGWTNKEVATSLFISVKTVESNLRHIYRKLGVASRRELARLEHPNEADQTDQT
jgi:DNA-binding CsgD family transcriptional regulator